MTDYGNIFENALNEAFDSARLPDDEKFIELVKERSGNMKTKKIKLKKPAVIAVSVGAAAVLTVSAGAALNWDIASLFTQKLETVKEDNQAMMNSYYEFFPEEFGGEIPDGAAAAVPAGEREYDILQAITHPIDETAEFDGYTVHIDGYAFDGVRLDVIYDITYNDELYDRIKENKEKRKTSEDYDPFLERPVSFRLEANGESISPGANGDHITEAEDGAAETRLELITEIPDGVETAELTLYRYHPEKADIMTFEVDLTPPEGLSLNIDAELSRTLPDGTTETISDIQITPFGTQMNVVVDPYTEPSMNSPRAQKAPIFLFYDDGTIIDISGIGNHVLSHEEVNGDGTASYRIYISSRGNVLDVSRIKSIKIYNEQIDIK